MFKLNLPDIDTKTKVVKGTTQIFDVVRKKYFILSHEEWVRQHMIHYLHFKKKYPIGLMGVEKMVKYNSMRTRADIIVYNNKAEANIIVECKSPKVKINQNAFDQIAKYNFILKVPYLIVTNGIEHFFLEMDYENNSFSVLEEVPDCNLI